MECCRVAEERNSGLVDCTGAGALFITWYRQRELTGIGRTENELVSAERVMHAWCPDLLLVQRPGRLVAGCSSCRGVELIAVELCCCPALGGRRYLPVRAPLMVSCSSSCLCLPAHYCVTLYKNTSQARSICGIRTRDSQVRFLIP